METNINNTMPPSNNDSSGTNTVLLVIIILAIGAFAFWYFGYHHRSYQAAPTTSGLNVQVNVPTNGGSTPPATTTPAQ